VHLGGELYSIKYDWAGLSSYQAFAVGHSIALKNHKRQRRKRQSVTAKREKSQTPKFV